MLQSSVPFNPASHRATLQELPPCPAVFALFGSDPKSEPYLARTTNLRQRLSRFLDAKSGQTKRLRLTEKVARIEYTLTGSSFESDLVLYRASIEAFGERGRKRLHLRAPALIRMTVSNRFPRVYVTNKVTKSALDSLFGPFPSRAIAERYCDEMLNLFLLRRCHEDLDPDPAFPGCIYSEMKMCLAPCFKGCTDERYGEESARVHGFLQTRGQSLLRELSRERDAASEELDFERAAALHARIGKVESVAALASDAVRPLSRLRALIVQPSIEPGHVALYLFSSGMIAGPALYSTLGMRLHNEQSGSSSLYTHPYAVEAVPLDASGTRPISRDLLNERLSAAITELEQLYSPRGAQAQFLTDHLSLFSRWYHRPAGKRVGEAIFWDPGEPFPEKPAIRAISRVYSSANRREAGEAAPVALS